MTSKAVHLLVFDGYADWEPAHALSDLRRSGNRSIVVVGFSAAPRVACLKYLVGDENHTNAALPQLAPLIQLTRHMDDTNKPLAPWTASRSAKEKNIVQRAVTALLDQLAPERVLKRGDQILAAVEQHRTPKGCVLQAPTAAVSVSWFADAGKDSPLGELHIIVWSGVVSRRGRAAIPEGAKVVKELVVRPIESPLDEFIWRAADGKEFDTAALAARCIAMLEEQL